MATIKDVADKANVSIATVSRVLNANQYVSPELAQRVRQAITDLNYEHNALARSLRRSESRTLGIIIPDSSNPFFAEVTRGVEDTVSENGYMVLLCNTSEDPTRAEWYLSTLHQHRIAGLIVVSPGNLSEELDKQRRNHPIVIVDRPLPGVETDMVISDNYGGALQAVRYLLELGHRRIGYVSGSENLETIKLRWRGVNDALAEYGLTVDEALIFHDGDFAPGSGKTGAEYLLQKPDPPTAIFAFNDLMAYGILGYAHERGVRVPGHLSVIGFDDIDMSRYTTPGLTTIAQPKYDLGKTVAEILLKRIEGDESEPCTLTLPTELIIRASTAAPGNTTG